jgi:hypothetical protein
VILTDELLDELRRCPLRPMKGVTRGTTGSVFRLVLLGFPYL